MTINSVPISKRTLPYSQGITAGGGYTLPQYAFIPHPALKALASGAVAAPSGAAISANFVLPTQFASRPYPVPTMDGVYAMRQVQVKRSP